MGLLDTEATISIVSNKGLPRGDLKKIMPTAAIRMGDDHVVHSCGNSEVQVPMKSRIIVNRFYVMDTRAFDSVWGPHSSPNSPRFNPSRCKHPICSIWTMVMDRNLYPWGSLSRRQAT